MFLVLFYTVPCTTIYNRFKCVRFPKPPLSQASKFAIGIGGSSSAVLEACVAGIYHSAQSLYCKYSAFKVLRNGMGRLEGNTSLRSVQKHTMLCRLSRKPRGITRKDLVRIECSVSWLIYFVQRVKISLYRDRTDLHRGTIDLNRVFLKIVGN